MKVLIAEDNQFYQKALKAMVESWGYEVVTASDGGEAWEVLRCPQAPKLAIIDWMMPKIDGIELCRKVRSLPTPEPAYLIMLTNVDGKENVIKALNAGADDYLHKTFDRTHLQARLQVGKRIVGLQTTQTVVFTFARAVDAKSPYTQGHSERVTHYALALAKRLGISNIDIDTLRRGAMLHDVGKISIPDAIHNKQTALTEEEFKIIKQHPLLGVEIVEPLQSLQDVLPLIRWHHERIDGKGYPDGLAGNDIPYLVRILSVADVYDALSNKRPYRSPFSHEECGKTLMQEARDGGLDPELVAEFNELPIEVFPDPTTITNFCEYRLDSLPFTPVLAIGQDSA